MLRKVAGHTKITCERAMYVTGLNFQIESNAGHTGKSPVLVGSTEL